MTDQSFTKKAPQVYSPTIEWILANGKPEPIPDIVPADPNKEIVALATPVFQGICPRAFDAHRLLSASLGMTQGQNFWVIPAQEHMPFPDAPLFAVASMMEKERRVKRKADWFLWVEDDVIIPSDLFNQLRGVADPEKRPFVACVGYDRYPKFFPAVWDQMPSGELKRWTVQPPGGIVRVGATGLAAALFHRSLFDNVPQPWFAVSAGILKDTAERMRRSADRPVDVAKGIKPDILWSRRLNECNIPVYVHCGIEITHLGMGLPINGRTAPVLRNLTFMNRGVIEGMTRGGREEQGDTDEQAGKPGSSNADLRESVPAGVGSTQSTVDEAGPKFLT